MAKHLDRTIEKIKGQLITNCSLSDASEKVTDDISEYFDISDPDFKSLIEIQCSKIREVTA